MTFDIGYALQTLLCSVPPVLGPRGSFSVGVSFKPGYVSGFSVHPFKEIAEMLRILEVQSAWVLGRVGHAHVQVFVALTLHFVQGYL